MHKTVRLDLPHAPEGKLYLEGAGRSVLYVPTDLRSTEAEALYDLKKQVEGLLGGLHGYDAITFVTKDG